MNFESCLFSIKKELIMKYQFLKKEVQKTNADEKRLELINKIQLVVRKVMESVANGFPPVFCTIHANWENCVFDGRVKPKETKKNIKLIDFKRRKSRPDFAIIVFLLSKIHKLLLTEQTSTRRALYYENLETFKSQRQVDNGMREISHLLSAPSWELRVLATSKGIVAGPVVFTLSNGDSVDCGIRGGVSIPQNVLEIEEMSSSATWVLVVEKDASFQKLISAEASRRLGSCILITKQVRTYPGVTAGIYNGKDSKFPHLLALSFETDARSATLVGKGFPDLNSRILVCKFWELLQIPVLVLVDADPHGFEIMCVYRFGSLSMSPYSERLACPAVRWLGVHPSDIRPLLLDSKVLSTEDVRKIRSLTKRPYVEENEDLKTQLEILLEGNAKAEIEGVAGISTNYLTDVYVKRKIQCKEYL